MTSSLDEGAARAELAAKLPLKPEIPWVLAGALAVWSAVQYGSGVLHAALKEWSDLKRVLAIILGGGAGTRLYAASQVGQASRAPGRQIPSDRFPNQQLHQFWCQKDLCADQVQQPPPSNRTSPRPYNLSAGFGQVLSSCSPPKQTPD